MTPPERQALGWILQSGDVPACVAAVPVGAWSGPAAFLVGLLVDLQEVDVQVGALDIWELALPTVWDRCLMGIPALWDCEDTEEVAGGICATPKSVPLLPFRKIEGTVQGVVEGPTKRFLRTMFHPDELLLLPSYAPWTLEEVEAACELVTAKHAALLAYKAAVEDAERKAIDAKVAIMARGGSRSEVAAAPLDLSRVHPGWAPYLHKAVLQFREAA